MPRAVASELRLAAPRSLQVRSELRLVAPRSLQTRFKAPPPNTLGLQNSSFKDPLLNTDRRTHAKRTMSATQILSEPLC